MIIFLLSGKGDLVGCDINAHLQCHNSNNGQMGGGSGGTSGNADVIVKSSSDVKVNDLSLQNIIFFKNCNH